VNTDTSFRILKDSISRKSIVPDCNGSEIVVSVFDGDSQSFLNPAKTDDVKQPFPDKLNLNLIHVLMLDRFRFVTNDIDNH